MIRFAARAVALLALVAAWGFSAGDRLVAPFFSEARAEPTAAGDRAPDLASLKVFNRVVLQVKENYFDPTRIDPQQMLVDSLDYVEKQVPEVMVDGDTQTGQVKVNVGGKIQSFPISDVDSIFKMSLRLGQIMGFVQKNLDDGHPPEDLRNIEYALVNGMLSSLDPHSVLLKPEYFREMKMSTRGEFGGLGFMIGLREGELTVMRVFKGTKDNPTPATRFGIKARDRILQIDGESTVNMDVTEAAQRLRGKPGSIVEILLDRKDWPAPKLMEIPRAQIEIESVVPKLLSDGVGYIRLKNFQGYTTRDLLNAVRNLKAEAGGELQGLVLDLRGNPGGLLDQAHQVADAFLQSGTIVTTVGAGNRRLEVKRASDQGLADLEKELPVAVLVNGGSASASEIVAGAIKNLDRGIVIGRTTFGKGSVQVLYDFPDQSALKLTIAQYLTPGDVSIQETGIVPDIELIASRVDERSINVFAPLKTMREEDLNRHLSNPADILGPEPVERPVTKTEDPEMKPLRSLRYLRDSAPVANGEAALDDEEAEDIELAEDFVEDYQIRFARDLLLAHPHSKRSEIIESMDAFVAERDAEEAKRIEEAIAELGVDWSKGPEAADAAGEAPKLSATFSPGPGEVVRAGEEIDFEIEVKNEGTQPVYRLSAWTQSPANPFLDRREFVFGAIPPGESRSWSVSVELPQDLASRRDPVTVTFEDARGNEYPVHRGEVNIAELPKPRFSYSWQLVERSKGGDGIARAGDKLSLLLDVKNVGPGASSDSTVATIKNKGNEKIFIEKGRQQLGALAPGETGQATFELELKSGYTEDAMPLQLLVYDEKLQEMVLEQLRIPVASKPLISEPLQGFLQSTLAPIVRNAANDDAPPLALVGEGASLPVDAKVGDWARVQWEEGRIGFVRLGSNVKISPSGEASLASVERSFGRIPPEISLDVDTSKGGIATSAERYTLSGVAKSEDLRDVYIFVNDQKVYFQPGPEKGGPLRFNAEFPLKEGANHVLVVARDGNEITSRRAIAVLRRDASEVVQKADAAKSGAPAKAP